MKKIFLVIATAITISASGQQHVVTYYDYLKIHKKEVYDLDKDAQPHGRYTVYWEDGSIAEQGTYSHGVLNGKYVKYVNSDGVRGVSDINNYNMGDFEGLQQTFLAGFMSLPLYKKPKEEKFYKNKHLVWVRTYVCPNYDEKKRYLWQWQQYRNGEQVWERGFYPDGKIMYSGNVVNINGSWAIADSLQNGKLIKPSGYESTNVEWNRGEKTVMENNKQFEVNNRKVSEEDNNAPATEIPTVDIPATVDTPKKAEKLRGGGTADDIKKLKQLKSGK